MPKVPITSRVTAIAECTFMDAKYWKLKEFDGGRINWWYDKRDFAILPEPSDEVAIEQEQEALIYQR